MSEPPLFQHIRGSDNIALNRMSMIALEVENPHGKMIPFSIPPYSIYQYTILSYQQASPTTWFSEIQLKQLLKSAVASRLTFSPLYFEMINLLVIVYFQRFSSRRQQVFLQALVALFKEEAQEHGAALFVNSLLARAKKLDDVGVPVGEATHQNCMARLL